MHSICWFWTTGIHNPEWVQAVAAVAVVVLTFVTLVVLCIYAYDTHTLARASVEQIDLVKQDNAFRAMRSFHIAYDCIFKVQGDLTALAQSFLDGTIGTKPQAPIYPDNWPDVASALNQRIPSTIPPTISLGIKLRKVDFAFREYESASNTDDKQAREISVHKATKDAGEECKRLSDELPKSVTPKD
jgi:hypothetical protein